MSLAGTSTPICSLRPLMAAPRMVVDPFEVTVPPTNRIPSQLWPPPIVKLPLTMRMPRPLAGSERSPVTLMIGQNEVSANAAEVGKVCGGTVMVGTSDDPLNTPAQSTRAESFEAGDGPRSLMGGLPAGIDTPPLCV